MWEVYFVLGIAVLIFSLGYIVKNMVFKKLSIVYSVAFLLIAVSNYTSYELGSLSKVFSFIAYILFAYTFFLNYRLIALQKKSHSKYYIDALTGVFNRAFLQEVMPRELKNIKDLGLNYVVFFIDMDNLKLINDTYGHKKGDEMLSALANVLKNSLRKESDLIIRYGGDEFLVFAPIKNCAESLTILGRIEKQIESINNELDPPLSISVGFACYPEDHTDFEKLIEIADKRMYNSKRPKK